MERGRIEQRHGTIFGRDQQHDLGAAEDDGLRALRDQAGNDLAIGRSGTRQNLAHDHHREFAGGTEVQRGVYGAFRWWW